MYYILRLLPVLILTHPSLENEVQEVSHFKSNLFTWIDKTDTLKLFDDSIFIKEIDALTSELEQLTLPNLKQLAEISNNTKQIYRLLKESQGNDWGNKSNCLNIPEDLADVGQTCYSSFEEVKSLISSLITFLGEINICANDSFIAQFKCYMQAFKDMSALVKEYSPEVKKILDDFTANLKILQYDMHLCFSKNDSK